MSDIKTIISHRDPRSPIAEAYRMLRTNLQFSSPDKPVRSLVVTSVKPGEGKTTTSANLAVSFAQTGNKVLLVDADMRKPTVHKFLGLNNALGLSNLIVSEDKAKVFIQPCWVDNLYVLAGGPIPPNPAELLSSKRCRQLFSEFEKEYNIVVIDSPPVAAVSDAVILSTIATGTLLVIKHGDITKDFAKRIVDQLRNVNANLLGVVLNQIPAKGANYYYYYDYNAKG